MRNFLLFILFVSQYITLLYAQDFYYYEGRRIDLQRRADKIAVVLKNNGIGESLSQQSIKTQLGSSDELKKLSDKVYLINFKNQESDNFINQKNDALNSLKDIIKFSTPVYYGESKKVTQIPTDEFVVRLYSNVDKAKLEELNQKYKCAVIRNIGDEKGFLLKSNDEVNLNALQLSDLYYQTGFFEYCEPDFMYPDNCLFNYDPNDPQFVNQWALKNTSQSTATEGNAGGGDLTTSAGISGADMDVYLAWDYVTGNNNVIVGVFDTGIDAEHPDLSPNLIAGYDAVNNVNSVTTDPEGHGTCTAGIIGARTNNEIGVAGIAGGNNTENSNCKIMSFKLVNSSGTFTTDVNIARAFDSARVKGVYVSSNSWGGGTPSTTLTNAINNLSNNGRSGKGAVVLFSSGNNGKNPPEYPSYLASVVCVGASTRHDQKKAAGTGNQWWWGGNYGEDANGDLDIVAPTICYTTDIRGTGGYNTNTGGDYYETFNGTSASCPNAAGVAALIFSVNPNFTRNEVLDYLFRGCEKIDNIGYNTVKVFGRWNEYFGYGRVNAYNSVRLAMGFDITPPTIVHNNIDSHSSTYPTILTATIVDQNGASVPNSGNQRPQIFYRLNKNGAGWLPFDSSFAVSNSGDVFTFQIPGVGRQTEIQYYIKAQDLAGNKTTFPLHASAVYSYTLCYYAVGVITSETRSLTNWSPPDNGAGISQNINFPNSFSILDASVLINLSHSWVSDVMFYLWSPNSDANNNRVCLFSYNGGSFDNITNATTSDNAALFWRQSSPPYSNGTFRPEYIFTGLKGTNALGNWKFVCEDSFSGDAPTFTSISIILRKLSGSTSSCARLNTPVDSILHFGDPNPSTITEKDFYLKNDGTSSLTISSVAFTGTYSSMFSLVNTMPVSIATNDSALFRVRLNYSLGKSGKELLSPSDFQNALMQISTNDPLKPVYKVSLYSEEELPVELSSFTASLSGSTVKLNWKTATEVNNYGFEVERKSPSPTPSLREGALDWKLIGFVDGNGNSNSEKSYSFTDNITLNLNNTIKAQYRLKQIDNDGTFNYSNEIEVELNIVPKAFALEQNYPNPFNPSTKIKYSIPIIGTGIIPQSVTLKVYDVLGKEVATLVNEQEPAGNYEVDFNALNLASGIYLYRLSVGNPSDGAGKYFTDVNKMLLIK